SAGTSVEALREARDGLRERYAALRDLSPLAEQRQTLRTQISDEQARMEALKTALVSDADRLAKAQSELDAAKTILQDRQRIVALERQIMDLAGHRAALEDGQACPLCGAIEHPAIDEYRQLDPSQSQADASAAELQVQLASDRHRRCDVQCASRQADLTRTEQHLQALSAQNATLAEDWASRCGALRLTLA